MPHCKRSSEQIKNNVSACFLYVNSKVCPAKRKHNSATIFRDPSVSAHEKKSAPFPSGTGIFRPLANIKRRMFQVLK